MTTTEEARTPGQSLDLRDLHAANIARQAEWCPDQVPDLSFRGNELGGECGEAQNVIKKLERERQGWRGSRATKDDLADELADVVICADLCAVTAGIDLGAAVLRKFNATSEKQGLSVFLPATPAPSSPGVPGSVRALEGGDEAVFACACASWVRALISTHPAGQSTGQGSEDHGKCIGCGKALTAEEAEFLVNTCDGCEREEHESRKNADEPAPDSTRAGPVVTEEAVASAIEQRWDGLIGPAYEGDWIGWKRRDLCREFAKAALAARPAAPEAQGAWRVGCEQLYLDASAAIEGVAQELEAIDRTASAKMLRNALDTLLGVEPNATLPAADDATKRIVAHAWERFQRGVSGHADKDGGHERRACENCGGQKHTDMGTTVCSVCAGTGVETAVDSTIEAGTARGLDRAPPSAQEAWRSQAANDVLAERRRQIEAEGWTAEHDDTHSRGELASAAACYATELDLWTGYEQADRKGRATLISAERVWPWSGWWKPTDRRRNLVKAGALILAEIERLDRLPAPPASSGQESA